MHEERWLRAALLMRHKTQARVYRELKQIPLDDGAFEGAIRRAKEDLKRRALYPWIPPDSSHTAVLIVQGTTPSQRGVAVVGSRASDDYGLACARRVALDAVGLGLPVISGGAEGCDAAAHAAALEGGGRTVVVLGSGHDHLYPRRHRDLFERAVLKGGALMSPYWPDTPPRAFRFVARNRVIAELAEVTVVVRARCRSGALTTARYAQQRGRRVLVVPSDVGEALGQGCNQLLGQGAKPICGLRDLAQALDLAATGTWPVRHCGSPDPWPMAQGQGVRRVSAPRHLECPERRSVLEALNRQAETDFDTLVEITGLPVGMLSSIVLELEISGIVCRIGRHKFKCIQTG